MTRARYLALALITIVAGLSVYRYGTALGPVGRDVTGDALWAAMIFWSVSALAPRARSTIRGLAAACICFAVESSQRLQTPALNAIRRTTPGHLVLGSGFDPRDFASYAGGVATAMLIAYAVDRRAAQRPSG